MTVRSAAVAKRSLDLVAQALMGLCAGVLVTSTLVMWAKAGFGRRASSAPDKPESTPAFLLGALGAVMFALGLPLTIDPPRAAFRATGMLVGEPCLILGSVLLVAGWSMACETQAPDEGGRSQVLEAVTPFACAMSILIFGSSVAAWFGAPDQPIHQPAWGVLQGHPWAQGPYWDVLLLGCLIALGWVRQSGRLHGATVLSRWWLVVIVFALGVLAMVVFLISPEQGSLLWTA